jgi:hypothetical protein
VLLTKYYLDDHVRANDMEGPCARTGEKDVHKDFGWQNSREIKHFEYEEVRLVSLKIYLQNGGCVLACTGCCQAEDSDQWRALVNTVTNLRVP